MYKLYNFNTVLLFIVLVTVTDDQMGKLVFFMWAIIAMLAVLLKAFLGEEE